MMHCPCRQEPCLVDDSAQGQNGASVSWNMGIENDPLPAHRKQPLDCDLSTYIWIADQTEVQPQFIFVRLGDTARRRQPKQPEPPIDRRRKLFYQAARSRVKPAPEPIACQTETYRLNQTLLWCL